MCRVTRNLSVVTHKLRTKGQGHTLRDGRGDSEESGERPTRCLRKNHDASAPRAHIPSRTVRNGMWVPTGGTARLDSSGSATKRTSPVEPYPLRRLPIWVKMRWRDDEACAKSISLAPFLAIKWISQLPSTRCLFRRKYSRIRRLILFLCAAFPTFRVTVIPRRQCGSLFCWTTAKK